MSVQQTSRFKHCGQGTSTPARRRTPRCVRNVHAIQSFLVCTWPVRFAKALPRLRRGCLLILPRTLDVSDPSGINSGGRSGRSSVIPFMWPSEHSRTVPSRMWRLITSLRRYPFGISQNASVPRWAYYDYTVSEGLAQFPIVHALTRLAGSERK